MEITWDYLAGFTDGEGSIGIVGRAPRVTWGQKDKHQLEVLKDFLLKEGFHPNFYYVERNTPERRLNGIYMMNLCRRDEVLRFCQEIQPRVVLKILQCDIVLKWLEDNPRQCHTAELDHRLVNRYAEEGYTQQAIGKILGCSAQKIAKTGKRFGITFHQAGGKIENGKHVEAMNKSTYALHRQEKEKTRQCPGCGKRIYNNSSRCHACALKHRHQIKPESFMASNTKSVQAVTNPSVEQEKV